MQHHVIVYEFKEFRKSESVFSPQASYYLVYEGVMIMQVINLEILVNFIKNMLVAIYAVIHYRLVVMVFVGVFFSDFLHFFVPEGIRPLTVKLGLVIPPGRKDFPQTCCG